MGVEAKRRAMVAYEKAMRRARRDPRRELCERRVERRLRANKGWREQAREECERLGLGERSEWNWKREKPWKCVERGMLELREELERKVTKEMQEEVRREAVRETIAALGGFELTVYTAGSVEEGVRNGGAACVARVGEEEIVRRKPAGRWSSSFVAEAVALDEALEVVREREPMSALICTDSQALVRRLKSRVVEKEERMAQLRRKLREVCERSRVVIQWVPGHVGVEGNEWADREANNARGMSQEGVGIGFAEAKRRIGREVRYAPAMDARAEAIFSSRVKEKATNREEQVTLTQLRAGHCPRTAYYRKRIGVAEDATCRRCGEEEEKDHWLSCAAGEGVRRELGLIDVGGLADEERMGVFLRRAFPEWLGQGRRMEPAAD